MSSMPQEEVGWGWAGGGPVVPLRRVAPRGMSARTAMSSAGQRVDSEDAAADEPGRQFRTSYNLVAGFSRGGAARFAMRVLQGRGVPPAAMTLDIHSAGDTDEKVAALRSEMQIELGDGWASPTALMTATQARGALLGALLAGSAFMVAGLVVGVLWAVGFRPGPPAWARIVSPVLVLGAAGVTIGFLDGGGLAPRRGNLAPLAERDVLLGVHSNDRSMVEGAAEVLTALGADRVDLFDGDGTPLPPQYAHPRPADPPGWWWRRAGLG